DVGTEVRPRERAGVSLGEGLEALASGGDVGLGRGEVAVEWAEDRVVLEQVGQRGVVREVVDADDLDVGAGGLYGAVEVAAEGGEAIDPNANSHLCVPSRVDACRARRQLGLDQPIGWPR